MTKTCCWCNQEFEAKRKDSRYCQRDHYKSCENCGTDFKIANMKYPKKSCSKKCADALTAQKSVIKKTCELCHQEFTTTVTWARFCAEDHYKNCSVCGEHFKISNPHQIPSTCSRECAWESVENKDDVYQRRNTTIYQKYGVHNISQSELTKQKKREAALEKYGVENVSQAEEVQKKREQTFLNNYGVTSSLLDKGVREKIQKTSQERYGAKNVFLLKEFQDKAREAVLERYGVENIFLLPENQLKAATTGRKRISKLNRSWQEILHKELGVEFELEKQFGENSYADLAYDDVFIDINPTVTHNSTISYPHMFGYCKEEGCSRHLPRDKNYHQRRALEAEANGKSLLQYFDWYDQKIFIEIVRAKLKAVENNVYMRSCELKVITQAEANRFFAENHLMGRSNGQTLCLGVFYEGELVHCQSYGPTRFSKKAEWEAIRSCSKRNWRVVGAFSKCDKYFFSTIDPESVVSYVDLSISQGQTDAMFDGWSLEATNRPGATWAQLLKSDANHPVFVKDSAARRVSADRLLGFEVGDKYPRYHEDGTKVTNDHVLVSEGYVKVYDAGTKTFIWRKTETS